MRLSLSMLFLAALAVMRGADELPALDVSNSADGTRSLRMVITKIGAAPEGGTLLVAKADYQGSPVAIGLRLGTTWKKLPQLPGTESIFEGTAWLVDQGEASKTFVNAVAATYERKVPSKVALKPEEMKAFFIGQPKNLAQSPSWIQFVRGVMPSSEYAAWFMYVDVPGRFVQIEVRGARPYADADRLIRLLAGK